MYNKEGLRRIIMESAGRGKASANKLRTESQDVKNRLIATSFAKRLWRELIRQQWLWWTLSSSSQMTVRSFLQSSVQITWTHADKVQWSLVMRGIGHRCVFTLAILRLGLPAQTLPFKVIGNGDAGLSIFSVVVTAAPDDGVAGVSVTAVLAKSGWVTGVSRPSCWRGGLRLRRDLFRRISGTVWGCAVVTTSPWGSFCLHRPRVSFRSLGVLKCLSGLHKGCLALSMQSLRRQSEGWAVSFWGHQLSQVELVHLSRSSAVFLLLKVSIVYVAWSLP